MTRHRRRGRRTTAVLLATGLGCLTAAALPVVHASAEDEPGDGLGSFSLSANAPVAQLRYADPANNCGASAAGTAGCEGVVNETVSTLRNGPIGYALSSVGWPGTLAGNLGSLLIVASGGQLPPESTALNSPVRAENTISGSEDTVVNSSVPGATMTATATPTKVAATASIGSAQSTPLGSLGSIASGTRTELTGTSTAEAVAHSEVHNVNIGGVITIDSVVSDAKAVTNGTTAVPSGGTRVVGATIAGVPVRIDEKGVTVQAQSVPLPSAATDAVNTALGNAGMTIAVSSASGTADGASVTYTAGSLVVLWKMTPTQSLTLSIGGAQVSVASEPGYDFDSPPLDDPGPPAPVQGGQPPAAPSFEGGTAPPPVVGGEPGPVTGGAPLAPLLAGNRLPLPGGLSPWLGVLAVTGAVLMMAGLRRLPDQVLTATSTACPMGDTA